jgi:hypothetical protein
MGVGLNTGKEARDGGADGDGAGVRAPPKTQGWTV